MKRGWALPFTTRGKTADQKSMLSSAELAYYNALKQGVDDRFLVLLKVDVDELCDMVNAKMDRGPFKPILSKRLDFVLCDPVTLTPKLAVELDDSTHYTNDRAERDALLSHLCRTVGVALIRQRVQDFYDPHAIASWIRSVSRSP